MTTASGLVVVDKPAGITSHTVVSRLRRLLGTRKIGHAGTLDPMATGVLILGVNRATRLLGHLALHDKRYVATVRLGQATDSDDADGTVTATADASGVTREAIEAAGQPLRGRIQQVPSTVSAIKVDGKRAYALAREGATVELKAREVEVSRLDVVAVKPSGTLVDVDIDVECSSGTYIRALARDLGAALGTGGHLTALRRTRVGGYGLDVAVELGDQPPPLLSMAEAARLSFPCVIVDEAEAADVGFGRPLARSVPAPMSGIIDPEGNLIALYAPRESGSGPLAVLIG